MRVTTADFIKHYGSLADRALTEPVTITKNGRDRLVVLSAEEYARLKRRDRRVIAAGTPPHVAVVPGVLDQEHVVIRSADDTDEDYEARRKVFAAALVFARKG